jgi:hypothetical protein
LSYQQVTLAELTTLEQARCDNPKFWSQEEYTQSFNEALSLMQLATGRWRKRYVVTTVPNRCFYNVPLLPQLQFAGLCQVLQTIRVAFNGSQPLGWTSFSDLDMSYPGWQAQTTDTPGAPDTPQFVAPAGVNWIILNPADAEGGNSLTFDVVTNAPQLANPGDFINLDTTEIVGVLGYAQHRLAMKRGGVFFQRTFPLLKSYYQLLANRNSYLLNLSIFKQQIGADFARNYAPRRVSERSGIPVGIGTR